MTGNRKSRGSGILGVLLLTSLAATAQAQNIEENEALVMQLIFDDCLGFVEDDATPFGSLTLLPLSPEGRKQLPLQVRETAEVYHLLSSRYITAWGEDERSRYCMIQTLIPSDEVMKLGVKAAGFLDRVTQRAEAAGLTENALPDDFTPLQTTLWKEPEGESKSGLRLVVMPTGGTEDGRLMDAGLIVLTAGPDRKNR